MGRKRAASTAGGALIVGAGSTGAGLTGLIVDASNLNQFHSYHELLSHNAPYLAGALMVLAGTATILVGRVAERLRFNKAKRIAKGIIDSPEYTEDEKNEVRAQMKKAELTSFSALFPDPMDTDSVRVR